MSTKNLEGLFKNIGVAIGKEDHPAATEAIRKYWYTGLALPIEHESVSELVEYCIVHQSDALTADILDGLGKRVTGLDIPEAIMAYEKFKDFTKQCIEKSKPIASKTALQTLKYLAYRVNKENDINYTTTCALLLGMFEGKFGEPADV